MIPIIQRYLALEVLKSSVATTLILFIILMSNTLGRVLSDISEGKTPADALFPVMLGQSVSMLNLLLPLGFFLGLVFALGRLYSDHELVVLQACGFDYPKLYQSVSLVLLPALGISLGLSLWLGAYMQQRAIHIVDEKENVHEFTQLKPGQFNRSGGANQVFFMQSVSADRTEIEDIIISQQGEAGDILETARKGRHRIDDATGDLFLELGPGHRYEGSAGRADYRIISFERHGILLKKKATSGIVLDSDEKTLTQILNSKIHKDRVELWWRITIPVTLVVLALIAVPLAYIAPRQGRFGKIGWSLLVFILYLNLLGFTKSALENQSLPLWLNFWWVHFGFLMLAIALLMIRTRTTPRLLQRSRP